MFNTAVPEIKDEMGRILNLSSFDLDYSALQNTFKDLTKLAGLVTKTEVSLINLIDNFTQWTITNHGIDLDQMPREDSVCQYTIAGGDHFEVGDLKSDDRFKDKEYVAGPLDLKYYFGVPLKTRNGFNIGALCVLDKQTKQLDPEKIEMLKIIAKEIVHRLELIKQKEELSKKLKYSKETQRKLAHDIRGPLGGIVGLAKLILEQGKTASMDEVLEINQMIADGGTSILDLADSILSKEINSLESEGAVFNLKNFKEKLEKLYAPQALNKNIDFSVVTKSKTQTSFSKNKLLQITGNLISNAIKFTPQSGSVRVDLELNQNGNTDELNIVVADSGVGIDPQIIDNILKGHIHSTAGTSGENGYGFGLALVKHLVEDLNGTIKIESAPGKGAAFNVTLPSLN